MSRLSPRKHHLKEIWRRRQKPTITAHSTVRKLPASPAPAAALTKFAARSSGTLKPGTRLLIAGLRRTRATRTLTQDKDVPYKFGTTVAQSRKSLAAGHRADRKRLGPAETRRRLKAYGRHYHLRGLPVGKTAV